MIIKEKIMSIWSSIKSFFGTEPKKPEATIEFVKTTAQEQKEAAVAATPPAVEEVVVAPKAVEEVVVAPKAVEVISETSVRPNDGWPFPHPAPAEVTKEPTPKAAAITATEKKPRKKRTYVKRKD
jgi:hypothetical protein